LSSPTSVFEQVLAALDRLEIPYFIGGSVASGSYGLPCQTNDIDIVADFSRDQGRPGRLMPST
jgi:hypothetical protein